ncbi:SirB2 family protein [Janthinobacterium aquaticum]|uniref:SirB2 family protein n=1 Tax=Janthinobacterium sp. FT58W TaxID=2654254 RepID=UPI0012651A2E|nr:SirB2 family protein [Janthinobacterium sp. FT58W]KAB8038494.1 regulator SirB [Janthinobacterium sp. FT58W]
MDYLALKHFHMGCAAASGALFLLRGLWMLRASSALQQRWVRILPHLVDTALLVSAITLAVWSGQSPGSQPWLVAKLVALVAYIVLGTIAIKRGKTLAVRATAFVAALLVYAYIIMVAVSKQPWPL